MMIMCVSLILCPPTAAGASVGLDSIVYGETTVREGSLACLRVIPIKCRMFMQQLLRTEKSSRAPRADLFCTFTFIALLSRGESSSWSSLCRVLSIFCRRRRR